jgi:hypothetical protein
MKEIKLSKRRFKTMLTPVAERKPVEKVRKFLCLYLAVAMALTQALPYGLAQNAPVTDKGQLENLQPQIAPTEQEQAKQEDQAAENQPKSSLDFLAAGDKTLSALNSASDGDGAVKASWTWEVEQEGNNHLSSYIVGNNGSVDVSLDQDGNVTAIRIISGEKDSGGNRIEEKYTVTFEDPLQRGKSGDVVVTREYDGNTSVETLRGNLASENNQFLLLFNNVKGPAYLLPEAAKDAPESSSQAVGGILEVLDNIQSRIVEDRIRVPEVPREEPRELVLGGGDLYAGLKVKFAGYGDVTVTSYEDGRVTGYTSYLDANGVPQMTSDFVVILSDDGVPRWFYIQEYDAQGEIGRFLTVNCTQARWDAAANDFIGEVVTSVYRPDDTLDYRTVARMNEAGIPASIKQTFYSEEGDVLGFAELDCSGLAWDQGQPSNGVLGIAYFRDASKKELLARIDAAYQDGFIVKMQRTDFDQNGGVIGVYPVVKFALIQQYVQPLIDIMNVFSLKNESVKIGPSTELELKIRSQVVEDVSKLTGLSQGEVKKLIDSIVVDLKTMKVSIKFKAGNMNSSRLVGPIDEDALPDLMDYQFEKSQDGTTRIKSAQMIWRPAQYISGGLTAAVTYGKDGAVQQIQWTKSVFCQKDMICPLGMAFLYTDSYSYGGSNIIIRRDLTSAAHLVMTLVMFQDQKFYIAKLAEYGPEDSLVSSTEFQYTGYYIVEPRYDENGNWVPGVQGYLVNNIFRKDASGRALSAISVNMFEHKAVVSIADSGEKAEVSFTTLNDLLSQARDLEAHAARIAKIIKLLKSLHRVVQYQGYDSGKGYFLLKTVAPGEVVFSVTVDPCQGRPGCMAPVSFRQVRVIIEAVDVSVDYFRMPVVDLANAESVVKLQMGAGGLVFGISLPKDPSVTLAGVEETPEAVVRARQAFDKAANVIGEINAGPYVTLKDAKLLREVQLDLKAAVENLPEEDRADFIKKFNEYLAQEDRIVSSKSMLVELADGRKVVVRNSTDVMAQIIRRFRMLVPNGEVDLGRLAGIAPEDLKKLESAQEYFNGRLIGSAFDLPSFDLFSPLGYFELVDRLVRKYPVTVTEGSETVLNVEAFLRHVDGTRQVYDAAMTAVEKVYASHPFRYTEDPMTLEGIKKAIEDLGVLNQLLAEAANQVIAGFQGEEVFRSLVSEQIAGVLNRYDSQYIQYWQQLNQAFYNRNLTLVINNVKVSVSRADLNEFANRLPNDTFDLYRYPGVNAQVDPSFLGTLIRQSAYNQLAQIRLGRQPLPGAPEEWPSDPRLAHLLMAYPAKFQVLEAMLKTWAKEVILADGTVNFDKLRFRMLISYELELELGKAEEYLKNQTARMNEIGNKKVFTTEDYASMKALLEESKKELQKRFNPLLKDVIYDTFNEVTVRVQDRFKMLTDAFNGILAKVSVAVQLADGTVLVVKPSDIRQRVLEPILNAMSIRGSNGAFTTDAYLRMNGVDASMVEGLLDLNAMSQLTTFDFNVWTSSYKTPYLADSEILFRLIPRIVGNFGTADTAALTKKLTENVEMPVPVGESLEAVIAQTIEKLGVNALAGLDAIKIETIEDYLKVREVVRSYVRDLTERLMKLTRYLSSTEISQIESGVNYWSGKYPNNLWAVLQKFVSKVDAIDSLTVNGIRVPVAQIRNIENFPAQIQYDTELFPGIVAGDFAGAETTAQRAVYSSISLGRSLYVTGGDNGSLTGFGRTQVAIGIVKRLSETVPPPAGIFFDKNGVKEVDPEIFRQYIKGVLAMKEAVYAEARQRTAGLIAEFKALEKGAYTIEEINGLHDKLLALRQGLIDFLSAKAQKHERRDVIATEDAVSLIYQEAFKAFVSIVGRAKLVVNVRGVSVTVPAKEITDALVGYLKKNVNEKVSASEFAKLFGIDVEMVRRVHKLENYLGEQIVDLPRNAEYVQIVSQISELGYMQLAVMLVEKYGGQVVKNGAVDAALLIDLVTNKDVAVGYFKKAADGVYGEAVAAIRAFDGKPMTLKDIESFAGILSDLRVRLVSMGNDFLSGNADDALQKDLEVYITSLYEKLRQLCTYENRTFTYEVDGQKVEVKLTKEMMGKFFSTIMEYLFTHPGKDYIQDEIFYVGGKPGFGDNLIVPAQLFSDVVASNGVAVAKEPMAVIQPAKIGIWLPVQPMGDYNPAYHPTELAMAVLFCRLAVKYGEFAVKPDGKGALQFDLESFLKELLLTDQSRTDRRLDRILEENLPRLQKYLEDLKDSNGAIPVVSLDEINTQFVDVRNMILAFNDRSGKAQRVWDAFMKLYEETLLGEKSLLSFDFNGRKVTFEAGTLDKILMDLYSSGKLDPAVTKKFADLINKGETQWAYNSFRWLQMWFEPIYFDYGRNIVQAFDSLSPEEGDAAHMVDRLITFGALATIPGINSIDLSGLEAAETAGKLKLTPVDPETLMGLLDMRSLAPGSGVSAGGLMSASYAKAASVVTSMESKVVADYVYWPRPIGWELGNTSQRFRDFQFLPEVIRAIAESVGAENIFAKGKVNPDRFRDYLQNFPLDVTPEAKARRLVVTDLISSFGFNKTALENLLENGSVKIKVDVKDLSVTVSIDPSVKPEDLLRGASMLVNPLGERALPTEIDYRLGRSALPAEPAICPEFGECPPSPAVDLYHLDSGKFVLGNLRYDLDYLGYGLSEGTIRPVSLIGNNRLLSVSISELPRDSVIFEKGENGPGSGFPIQRRREVVIQYEYYTKDGVEGVLATILPPKGVLGGTKTQVDIRKMEDGQYHVKKVTRMTVGTAEPYVVEVSEFTYLVAMTFSKCPLGSPLPCPPSYAEVILSEILRHDGKGNPLSKIGNLTVESGVYGADVKVDGAPLKVLFNSWQELFDEVRKLEGKQDFIREAIAKYLKISSKDILQLDLEDVEDFVTCMGPGCPTWSKYVSVLALVDGEKKHFAGQVTGGGWGVVVFDEATVKAMDLNGDGMIDENDFRLFQFALDLPDLDGNGTADENDFNLLVLAMGLPDLDGNGIADEADFNLLVLAVGLPDLDGDGRADENDYRLLAIAFGLPDFNGDGVKNDSDVQALLFALNLPDFNKDGMADRVDAAWLHSLLVEYRSSNGVIVIEGIQYAIGKNAYGIVRFTDEKGRIFVADKEGLVSLNGKLYVVKEDLASGDYIVKPYQMEIPITLVDINQDGKFDLQDVLAYENGLRVREIGDMNGDGLFNALDVDMYMRGLQAQKQGDLNGDGILDQKDLDSYRSGLQVRKQGDVNGDGITDQKDLDSYRLGLQVRKQGDVNGDGTISQSDLSAYKEGLGVLAQADFNRDGVTNLLDLNLLASYLMSHRLSSIFLLETDPLIDGRALAAIAKAANVAMDQLTRVEFKLHTDRVYCQGTGCPLWSGDLKVTVKQGENSERYFEGEIAKIFDILPAEIYRVFLREIDRQLVNWVNDPAFNFDFDRDGKLSEEDYTLFKQFDGEDGDVLIAFLTPEAKKKLDLNRDGVVSPEDVLQFGEEIKLLAWVNDPAFNFDFDRDGKLTAEDYTLFKSFDGQEGDRLDLQGFLTPEAKRKLDLNRDGLVSPDDVVLFGNWIQLPEEKSIARAKALLLKELPGLNPDLIQVVSVRGVTAEDLVGTDLPKGFFPVHFVELKLGKYGPTLTYLGGVDSITGASAAVATKATRDYFDIGWQDAGKSIAHAKELLLKRLPGINPDDIRVIETRRMTVKDLDDGTVFPDGFIGHHYVALGVNDLVLSYIGGANVSQEYFPSMAIETKTTEDQFVPEADYHGQTVKILENLSQVVQYTGGEKQDDRYFMAGQSSGAVVFTVLFDPCPPNPGGMRCMAVAMKYQVTLNIRRVDHPVDYFAMPVVDLTQEGEVNLEMGPNGLTFALSLPADRFHSLLWVEEQPFVDDLLMEQLRRDILGRVQAELARADQEIAQIRPEFDLLVARIQAQIDEIRAGLEIDKGDLKNLAGEAIAMAGKPWVEPELRAALEDFQHRALSFLDPSNPEGAEVLAQRFFEWMIQDGTAELQQRLESLQMYQNDLFNYQGLVLGARSVEELRKLETQFPEQHGFGLRMPPVPNPSLILSMLIQEGQKLIEESEQLQRLARFAEAVRVLMSSDGITAEMIAAADANKDGKVNQADAAFFKESLMDSEKAKDLPDLNGDGVKDVADYELLVRIIDLGGAVIGDMNMDGVVDEADVDVAMKEYADAIARGRSLSKEVFDALDVDHDGVLTKADEQIVIAKLGEILRRPQILVKVNFGGGILQIVSQTDANNLKKVEAVVLAANGDAIASFEVDSYDNADLGAIVIKTPLGEKVTFYPKTATYQSIKNIESDVYPGIPLTQTQLFKLVQDTDGKSKFEMTSNVLRNALTGAMVQSAVRRQTPSGLVEFFKAQMPGEMGYTITLARTFNKAANVWAPYSGSIIRRNGARATVANASFSVEPSGVVRIAEADVRYNGAAQHVKMTFGLSLAFDECPKEWGLLCA